VKRSSTTPERRGRILVPFVPRFRRLSSSARRGLVTIGIAVVSFVVIITILAPYISPYNPSEINAGPILTPPCEKFPLGTNSLGEDMLSRVLSGGGTMLQVSLLSVVICLAIGVPIGLLTSYVGGAADRFASLVMDSLYAFPGLILAIAVAAMLGPGVINMALAIAFVYIPSYFRIVRSQALTIKELTYVEAARALGAKTSRVISKYIFPNLLPSVVVIVTVNFADAILTEAGLTFIGLGLPVSTPDWGWDLTFGRQLLPSGAWWVIAFPGLMIIIAVFGFTLLGEGLSEVLNPRLEEQA
jgi:peptide/nickel transport system permease protein